MADTGTPDDVPPQAKRRGTRADRGTMEADDRAQVPDPTGDVGRRPRPAPDPDAVAPPSESAAEDQAIDTVATGLVSSDEDETGGV
jgi:hypothetical protein